MTSNRLFLNLIWMHLQETLWGRQIMYGLAQGALEWCEKEDQYIGSMQDHVGSSLLRGVHLRDEQLSFLKKYPDREPISFSMKKGSFGWYEGVFTGEDVPSGIARCQISEFFLVPPMETFLIQRGELEKNLRNRD